MKILQDPLCAASKSFKTTIENSFTLSQEFFITWKNLLKQLNQRKKFKN